MLQASNTEPSLASPLQQVLSAANGLDGDDCMNAWWLQHWPPRCSMCRSSTASMVLACHVLLALAVNADSQLALLEAYPTLASCIDDHLFNQDDVEGVFNSLVQQSGIQADRHACR